MNSLINYGSNTNFQPKRVRARVHFAANCKPGYTTHDYCSSYLTVFDTKKLFKTVTNNCYYLKSFCKAKVPLHSLESLSEEYQTATAKSITTSTLPTLCPSP